MPHVPRAWLVLLILAGCTAKAPAEPAPEAVTVGSIAGVTVTPTIEPIAGALLELQPASTAAQSDLFGRFRFEAVPPGSYRLSAQATGHEPVTVTVTVSGGEVARPRIVLPMVQTPQPSHETFEFQGFFPAALGPLDDPARPATDALFGPCTCRFAIPTSHLTAGVVVEAVWQDSMQRPDEPSRFRWQASLPNATLAGNGSSPLHAIVAGDFGQGFMLDILPDAVWPSYEQAFQLFVTRWEIEPPPEDWSRVRGDP